LGELGQIWANLMSLGKSYQILTNLIKFGQNQNLASPKTRSHITMLLKEKVKGKYCSSL